MDFSDLRKLFSFIMGNVGKPTNLSKDILKTFYRNNEAQMKQNLNPFVQLENSDKNAFV